MCNIMGIEMDDICRVVKILIGTTTNLFFI